MSFSTKYHPIISTTVLTELLYFGNVILYNLTITGRLPHFCPQRKGELMKRHFLTRTVAILLVLVLALGTFVTPAMAANEDGVVIKLHYNRPDGVYDGWSVWFWNYGQEGVDTPFAEEDGEMVATFLVTPGTTTVGFIVKLPDWAAKDVDMDQFIDVTAYTSGTVHVYVESQVEGYELVLGDDVESGIKVKQTVYKEGIGIRVATTAALSDYETAFTVNGPDGAVAISSVTDDGDNVYTLVTEEALDLYASYTLTYGEDEYEINMPNVYSTEAFEEAYTYEGDDLGATWTKDKTSFRLWAPTATAVTVNLYESGTAGTDDLIEQIPMTADVNGTWVAEKEGDLNGTYYTYSVEVNGSTNEACDPYARTTGVNGQRAMVIDLDATDPEGWENDTDPHAGQNITDAVIYELHVRDLSVDENSGIENKGKFLGLIETGTTNAAGVSTGLDHIKELGITHIHLLPSYDYGSVDESKLDSAQFNWGYDPVNYNVPEGSYSTDPFNGEVRVSEMKEMVKGLHDNGISVVMDVVYNHVYSADNFCFNQIVPGYFSRINDSGAYSNGSGCGNDTATERSMVKKYIVDSVLYWVEEYHIDGFRFDLVGLIDTETINAVIEEVHKEHPNVIFYGEGWTMSTDVTKEGYTLATQVNSTETPAFAFFSDTIRDALKGNVFNNSEAGYVSGAGGYASNISACFTATTSWCKSPTQTINYASCHDNMTLFDRLTKSTPDAAVEDRIKMNNLAAAIYMTAQGTPFMQAGEEMLRSKPLDDGSFDSNSYASSDAVNNLKWNDLNDETYMDVFNYYKGLIAFRQAHPALRMTSAEEVAAHVTTITDVEYNVTAFHITGGANGEENDIFFVFNPRTEATTVALPEGNWTVYINGEDAGTTALGTAQGEVTVDAISAMVLVNDGEAAEVPATEATEPAAEEAPASSPNVGIIIAVIAAVAVIAIAAVVIIKKRKK